MNYQPSIVMKALLQSWKVSLGLAVLWAGGGLFIGVLIFAVQLTESMNIAFSWTSVGVILLNWIPSLGLFLWPLAVLMFACSLSFYSCQSGCYLTLEVMGVRRHRWLSFALFIGLIGILGQLILANVLAPWGRAKIRTQIQSQIPHVVAGKWLELNGVAMRAKKVHRTHMQDVEVLLHDYWVFASKAVFLTEDELHLSGGQLKLRTDPHSKIVFAHTTVSLSKTVHRLEIVQRDTVQLYELLRLGKADQYMQRELYKRLMQPWSLGFLSILGFCLGKRLISPSVAALSILFMWWILIRICDQLSMFPIIAALLPLVVSAGVTGLGWWSESNR